MSKIEAIVFDFGGTLDNDGVDWFTRLYRIVNSLDASLTPDCFDEMAHRAANAICDLQDTPLLLMNETVLRICRHIHAELSAGNGVSIAWNPELVSDIFMAQAQGYLSRNRHLLSQLQRRYRLACISNNWGNTAGWCKQFQLADYFETMIDSTVAGFAKPDPRIFQLALDALDLSAESCVYVGDHYECDVKGSLAAGMQPIWIRPELPEEGLEPGVCRIAALPDLLDLEL